VTEFPAKSGIGKCVRAQALVAKDGFSTRYGLDHVKRVFSRPGHRLTGLSCAGRVLLSDPAGGGVATAWMPHEMQARGVVRAALVLNLGSPIMAQGTALADFSMVSGFAVDVTQEIPDGAKVEVDPEADPPSL
jgi:predicted aconitase with swiveling domain